MSALVSQGISAGPIYSWQDESGQIHYSDRPLAGEDQSQPIDLQTKVDGDRKSTESEQYSIREQVEYFDRKREEQRRALLEERRFRQEARAQELEQRRLEYEQERLNNSEAETVIYGGYPRYRPIYHHHRRHRRPYGVQVHSPYMRQYRYVPKLHQFSRDVGRPYPSYPLNFWKH